MDVDNNNNNNTEPVEAPVQTKKTVDEILASLKILYIHGLEGSNRDKRAQTITKLFPGAKCADMQTLQSMNRGKTFLRLGSLTGVGVIGYISYILGVKKQKIWPMILFILLSGTGLAFSLRALSRFLLRKMFDSNLELQKRVIKNFKPDLVIAGGYGGAVMAEIIRAQKYFYKNPLLFLAPAQDEWAKRLGTSSVGLKTMTVPKTIPKTVIVHGLKDSVISCQDSVNYATRSRVDNANVHVYLEEEDHRMGRTVSETNMKKWVMNAMSLTEE